MEKCTFPHVRPMTFEDLYDDISDHWQDKARRLQARRWHAIRHEMASSQPWTPHTTVRHHHRSQLHWSHHAVHSV